MNLPVVTEETIKEIGEEAIKDNEGLFMAMAASNPDLYRFVYGIYNLPETNKTTMLGVLVATYHVLDRQVGKSKKNRKRLKK